jgi:hypothetical protein
MGTPAFAIQRQALAALAALIQHPTWRLLQPAFR